MNGKFIIYYYYLLVLLMEAWNPNLTFVTPALLARDCTMSNIIGHEISHSWTGTKKRKFNKRTRK